jgi:hypothetical protein
LGDQGLPRLRVARLRVVTSLVGASVNRIVEPTEAHDTAVDDSEIGAAMIAAVGD